MNANPWSRDRGRFQALRAYAAVQPGSWRSWLMVWILQGIRHLPAYVLPFLTGVLIDHIDLQNPDRVLRILPWVMSVAFVLCVGNVLATTAGRQILSRINRTMVADLRGALLRRLHLLSLRFHDGSHQGSLQNSFLLDVGRLEALQGFLAEGILMHGTAIVVMLGIVAATNPVLLVVIAAAVPVNVLIVRLLWRHIQGRSEDFRVAEGRFLSHLQEAITGLRVTRAHATEAFMEHRVEATAQHVAVQGMRLDFVQNLFGSTSWAVSSLLHMAVVGLGVYLCVGGQHQVTVMGNRLVVEPISIGQLTVMLSYYTLISAALGSILGGLPAVAAADDAVASLSRLYQEGDEEPGPGRRPLTVLRGRVCLENVHFRYATTGRYSLCGVSFEIPPGTSVALVGASGSGKSTIASLVLGFYQPEQGRISIDGHDLAEVDRRSYRQQIGVVSQEVILFQGTVLDNIAWGDPQPDVARAREAASLAQALGFIEALPGGLDYELRDGGGGLSGGQRQRLALARAIYRDPRLLILDEATSALDPDSERLVQEALDGILVGRSTLIIAHRLHTVRGAGLVLVLQDGDIVERGTYENLIRSNGHFYRMARHQLQ